MEAGVLQQFGPGAELRDRPSNLFVATFLGEPPMNALPARVQPDGLHPADAPGQIVPLPGVPLPQGVAGVVLGVRPHHIRLGEGPLHGSVISNQWLGDQAHVVIELREKIIVAVSYVRVPVRIGETVAFGFLPEHTHLFDSQTGRALTHGTRPA
jgi:multiple sugar transport system ATP-binding protein